MADPSRHGKSLHEVLQQYADRDSRIFDSRVAKKFVTWLKSLGVSLTYREIWTLDDLNSRDVLPILIYTENVSSSVSELLLGKNPAMAGILADRFENCRDDTGVVFKLDRRQMIALTTKLQDDIWYIAHMSIPAFIYPLSMFFASERMKERTRLLNG